MPRFFQIIIRLAIFCVVIFFLVQPFNWYCQITQSCRPFFFSYYMPKTKGIMPINIKFEVTNFQKNLDFRSDISELTTVTNQKNLVTYYAKNNSKKLIRFRPKLIVEPEFAEKYLKRYECLCFREYRLKPGEEIEMRMEFEIERRMESDNRGKDPVTEMVIRYKI